MPQPISSGADRLWKARAIIAVFCLLLGISLFATLKPIAWVLAALALIIFAFGWPVPTITYRRKMTFIIASVALIVAVEWAEVSITQARKAEQHRHVAEMEAQNARQAAQQAENSFRRMTQAQHLSAAKNELHVGASEDQVADGMKQLDAVNGTPLGRRAKALRARYQAEKAKADELAAVRQEKETAEAQESARIAYATTIEGEMLDQGFNFDVAAIGAKHTIMRIKWALASKAGAYQMSENTQIFETARELGFKKIDLTNGFDFACSWNLQ